MRRRIFVDLTGVLVFKKTIISGECTTNIKTTCPITILEDDYDCIVHVIIVVDQTSIIEFVSEF